MARREEYNYAALEILSKEEIPALAAVTIIALCECRLRFTAVSHNMKAAQNILRGKYRRHLNSPGFQMHQHPSLNGNFFVTESGKDSNDRAGAR
jgi:hypothetical protein